MRPTNLRLYPDATELYIAQSGRVRTKSSREAVKIQLRALQNLHPKKGVRDFTTADLTARCLAPGIAPNTSKIRRAILQSFFGWAKFAGLCGENPSSDLKYLVQPGNYGVRRHTWLTKDEVVKLLSTMPTDTVIARRDRAIVATGLLTGMRLFEMCAFRWDHFSDDMTSITLTSKGQKLDNIGIPEVLWEILTGWRDECRAHQKPGGPVFPTFHYVMGDEGGMKLECLWNRPLGQTGINVVVKKAGNLIGVSLRPHDLRRTFSNLLEHQGFTIEDISRAMRHENISTTSVYLDRNPHRIMNIGQKLDIRLAG